MRFHRQEHILHLGDFALGNKTNFDLLTGMLKGRLFLIQGNHDRISKSYCETLGWINFHGHIQNVPPPPEGSNLGPSHINVSVEVREYRPWRLGELLKTFKNHPKENDMSHR